MDKKTPLVSIIIPTFNEALNIKVLIPLLHEALSTISHEIIVVDDDSPDQTWNIVEELQKSDSSLVLVRRKNKKGLSSAVIEGFDCAQGQILCVMDADLSHDEKILPRLIKEVEQGADLAVGSRRIQGGGADKWPFYRKLMSNVATVLSQWMVSAPLSDPMSGYFVLTKSFYQKCKTSLHAEGYKILLELVAIGNPKKIIEVPFIFKDRKQGYSKLTMKVVYDFLKMIWRLKKLRHSSSTSKSHQ